MVSPPEAVALQPAELQKWRFLAAAPYLDCRDAKIHKLAARLFECAQRDPERFANLAQCVCRDNVKFVRDTARVGEEDIAGYTRIPGRLDAVEALVRGADDCDAKARLFVALCLSVGIPARMEKIVTRAGALQHVYAIVTLDGRALPVELTLRRARVGDDPYAVPKEADGQWLR
jgi:transglutaminase-like putative cysteine protease